MLLYEQPIISATFETGLRVYGLETAKNPRYLNELQAIPEFERNVVSSLVGICAVTSTLGTPREISRRKFLENLRAGLTGCAVADFSCKDVNEIAEYPTTTDPRNDGFTVITFQNYCLQFNDYGIYFWKKSKPRSIKYRKITEDSLPFHLNGLKIGPIYHARIAMHERRNCATPKMTLSKEEIVFVARMPGNFDIDSPETANNIGQRDREKFLSSLGRKRGEPLFSEWCDFNYNGTVDDSDRELFEANFGRKQRNDLGMIYVDKNIIHDDGCIVLAHPLGKCRT